MPNSDESDLKTYIHKLEARIEALEKSAEERMHSFSEKWFKRSPSQSAESTKSAHESHSDRELRMVLMGPPGAGIFPALPSHDSSVNRLFREGDTINQYQE
jgi:hypothetical protein